MKLLRAITPAAILLLTSGCATHYYNVAGEESQPEVKQRIGSPVSRAPRTHEGRVLLKSGIGNFLNSRPPATLVDLGESPTTPARQRRVVYSAGMLPSRVPASRTLRVVEKTPKRDKLTDYHVSYVKRVSLWERFRFFHDDERTLARALAWAHVKSARTAGE
ncbi:MAG: hypothetical protein QM755_19275 [Luteolibacter sp.]